MAASELEFGVLGSLDVRRNGEPVEVGGGRQRALLGLLLIAGNRVVSADALVDALWPEGAPKTAQTVLQGYVSHLRKALEPERAQGEAPRVLVTDPAGYRLQLDADSLDAARFEGLVRRASAEPDAARRAAALEDALGLWRGGALADFAYASWAQHEAGRLEELRLAAREELFAARLDCGQAAEVVPELEAFMAEHPLRERPRASLMLALYRAGRQADALACYQAARERLVEELGIDPGPELQELHRKILNQDASLAAPDAPAAGAAPTNIPAAATELVGRAHELGELAALLGRVDVRLLTLTGTGGTGKTRLAIAAAAARLGDEPDGVWFVDLSALRDPQLVLPEIARTLGGQEDVDAVLAGKRLLLVLDNFEQVLDAAVPLSRLLRSEPGVRALVTSREPLRLEGEHEYPVDPLLEDDAVRLFTERARAVAPSFEPGVEVAQICRRLDGLPLAIQLAASRVKLLPPAAILERLERRLPLLTHGSRDLPERQQTLRATIAWSHELLSEEERRAFESLAVFVGGFTPEAAEEVAGVDLDVLAALVDRSLVRASDGRFSLLETIREFATERLEERGDAELRAAHAAHYLDLARRAEPELENPDQAQWMRRLELEQDNIRAVLSWSLEQGRDDVALPLAASCGVFWYFHGNVREGRRWLRLVLEREGPPTELRAQASRRAGVLAYQSNELDAAEEHLRVAADISRERGDNLGLGRALGNLGALLIERGKDDAPVLLEESRSLSRSLGDDRNYAVTTHNLGEIALMRGDAEAARDYFTEALAIHRTHGNWYSSDSLEHLGMSLLALGDVAGGAAALDEALELAREVDSDTLAAAGFEIAAEVAVLGGEPEAGARLIGAAAALREVDESESKRTLAENLARVESLVREALGEEAWKRELAAGRRLSREEASAEVSRVLRAAAPA